MLTWYEVSLSHDLPNFIKKNKIIGFNKKTKQNAPVYYFTVVNMNFRTYRKCFFN